jgi:hypothetical protein
MEAPNIRGGQRDGAGRPRIGAEAEQHVSISLASDQIAQLRRLGGGNASAGIRRLVASYDRGALGPLEAVSKHVEDELVVSPV